MILRTDPTDWLWLMNLIKMLKLVGELFWFHKYLNIIYFGATQLNTLFKFILLTYIHLKFKK